MDKKQARAIGSTCLALHVRRAGRHVARFYDEALRPFDLSNGQFSLLTMLAAKDDWTMQALADALGMDQSSLTAAQKPLRRRGLVMSRPDDDDGRIRRLVLSGKGRDLLASAEPSWRTAQARAEGLLGGSAETLRSQLNALV